MTFDGSEKFDKDAAARAIDSFLIAVGRDPSRDPELVGTGTRVAQAYYELCAGYRVDVDTVIRDQILVGNSALVVVRDLDVTTMCPHHLLPATGTAIVAFEPRGRLIGIGVIGRIVDAFARRLTLQEHIGERVTHALAEHLRPAWVACRLDLTHTCTTVTGERRHATRVQTVSIRGDEVSSARARIDAILAGAP